MRSGYLVLNRDNNLVSIESMKLLWDLKVEPATQMCVWRALINILPTRGNLVKREITLSCVLCPLCRKHTEYVQHLFLTCEITQKVWDSYNKWIGILSVRHYYLINHSRSFYRVGCTKKVNDVWKGTTVTIVREI